MDFDDGLLNQMVSLVDETACPNYQNSLTLMLLVVNFCQHKMMQKTWKMTETLAYGYSAESGRRDWSNEYKHDRA